MPDRREEEDEKEVTNPFVAIHRAVWRTVSGTAQSLRRQAPGARMIGEFAVKHVVSEAQKKMGGAEQAPPSTRPTDGTPTDEPGP